MGLRETTRTLMAEVEQTTGCSVVVNLEAGQHTFATVVMAAPNRSGHIVRIRPNAPAGIDYYVAYNCCMIRRFFENPRQERFVFCVGDKGHY